MLPNDEPVLTLEEAFSLKGAAPPLPKASREVVVRIGTGPDGNPLYAKAYRSHALQKRIDRHDTWLQKKKR